MCDYFCAAGWRWTYADLISSFDDPRGRVAHNLATALTISQGRVYLQELLFIGSGKISDGPSIYSTLIRLRFCVQTLDNSLGQHSIDLHGR